MYYMQCLNKGRTLSQIIIDCLRKEDERTATQPVLTDPPREYIRFLDEETVGPLKFPYN